jgi:methylmalonyl-CoA mutase
MSALQEAGMQHVLVVVGGVIPEQDHAELYDAGVAAIYGPGTMIPAAAMDMLELLMGPQRPDPEQGTGSKEQPPPSAAAA